MLKAQRWGLDDMYTHRILIVLLMIVYALYVLVRAFSWTVDINSIEISCFFGRHTIIKSKKVKPSTNCIQVLGVKLLEVGV